MDHRELIAEMAYIEKLSTQERLKLARRRRLQQLKKWREQERDWPAAVSVGGTGGVPGGGGSKRDKTLFNEARQRRVRGSGGGGGGDGGDDGKRVVFVSSVVLLEAAARNDIQEVRELLQSGAVSPNATNEDGLTALHQCCIDDSADMLTLLLHYGADVNAADSEKWTPLHAAATCGHLHLARILVQHGANLLAVNADGNMPYDICEDDATLDYIECEMAGRGVTQSMIDATRTAPEAAMLQELKEMRARGQALLVRDESGATPLHVAAANGYLSVCEFLLQHNLPLEVRDADDWTPLHAAACWGHPDVVELLVANGASLHARTRNNETPHDICEDYELRARLMQLLTEQQTRPRGGPGRKVRRGHSANTRTQSVRRTSIRDKNLAAKREAAEEARLRMMTAATGDAPQASGGGNNNNNSSNNAAAGGGGTGGSDFSVNRNEVRDGADGSGNSVGFRTAGDIVPVHGSNNSTVVDHSYSSEGGGGNNNNTAGSGGHSGISSVANVNNTSSNNASDTKNSISNNAVTAFDAIDGTQELASGPEDSAQPAEHRDSLAGRDGNATTAAAGVPLSSGSEANSSISKADESGQRSVFPKASSSCVAARSSSGVSGALNSSNSHHSKTMESDYGGAFYTSYRDETDAEAAADFGDKSGKDQFESKRESEDKSDVEHKGKEVTYYDDSVNSGYCDTDLVRSHFGAASVDVLQSIARQHSSSNGRRSSKEAAAATTTTIPSVVIDTQGASSVGADNYCRRQRQGDDVQTPSTALPGAALPDHSGFDLNSFLFRDSVNIKNGSNAAAGAGNVNADDSSSDVAKGIYDSSNSGAGILTSAEDSVVPLLDPQPDLIPESVRRKAPKPAPLRSYSGPAGSGAASAASFAEFRTSSVDNPVVQVVPVQVVAPTQCVVTRRSSSNSVDGSKKIFQPRPLPPPRTSSIKSESDRSSSSNGYNKNNNNNNNKVEQNDRINGGAKNCSETPDQPTALPRHTDLTHHPPCTVDAHLCSTDHTADVRVSGAYDSHYNTYDSGQSATSNGGIDIHVTVTVKPLAAGTLADLKQQRALNRAVPPSSTSPLYSHAGPALTNSLSAPVSQGTQSGVSSSLPNHLCQSGPQTPEAGDGGEVNPAFDNNSVDSNCAVATVTAVDSVSYRPPPSPTLTPRRYHGEPSGYSTPVESKSCCVIL